MTAKLTPNLRLRNARDFLENLVNHPIAAPLTADDASHKVDRNHYLFIARTKEWTYSVNPRVSETSPPTPTASISEDREVRDHFISFKKIRERDASLCVKRFNWDATGQTVYKPYDTQDPDLYSHPTPAEIQAANNAADYRAGSHYVMTDQFHVFKCLSNGNGKKSTVKPELPSHAPFTFSSTDGYTWMYVGTVDQNQTQNFLTNQWLPVQTKRAADDSNQWRVQQAAAPGAILSYIVDEQGTDYQYTHKGTFEAATSNTAKLQNDSNVATVDGAYVDSHVWIVAGEGSPSGPYKVTGYVASTRTITIEGTWSVDTTTDYEICPALVLDGNGIQASAKVIVNETTKKVTSVVPVTIGTSYTFATAEIKGGKATAGVQAKVRPQIAPVGGHGSDIERELNAVYVMLTSRLIFDDGSGDFPLANDYRQVGLIRDIEAPSGALATDTTLNGAQAIELVNAAAGINGDFQPDELIEGTDGINIARGRLISYLPATSSTNAKIFFYQDSSTGYAPFQNGYAVTAAFSKATANVASVILAEVNRQSGEILYIDNRRSIQRAPNQTEIIRVVIKF